MVELCTQTLTDTKLKTWVGGGKGEVHEGSEGLQWTVDCTAIEGAGDNDDHSVVVKESSHPHKLC
jgi:hypothetical protein